VFGTLSRVTSLDAPIQPTLLDSLEPAIDESVPFERVRLDTTSWIDMARGWMHGADRVLTELVAAVDWRQGRRWMYEREVDDPRLSRWYRPEDEPPHPVLLEAKLRLEHRYGVHLGGLGLNYYRDGRDSVAPHRDRELRDVDHAIVAIVTLGTTRPFLIRHRGGGPSRDLAPGSGDLIVMGGRCQADWEHAVPKTARRGPRISATYRWSGSGGSEA
jgi:alkylated DNA repair dioxygenase AlkB